MAPDRKTDAPGFNVADALVDQSDKGDLPWTVVRPGPACQIVARSTNVVKTKTGLSVPDYFRAVYGPEGNPLDPATPLVALTIAIEDGETFVTNLYVRGVPVPPQHVMKARLRFVASNFDQIVDFVTARAAQLLALEKFDLTSTDLKPMMTDLAVRRRRRIDDELLRRVAEVVRANPETPTKAVKEQLYTSHRNATRWIAEARKQNLLEEGK